MLATETVGEHERGGQRQGARERGADVEATRETRHGPGGEDEPDDDRDALQPHENRRFFHDLGAQGAPRQGQRTVWRRGVAPDRVDHRGEQFGHLPRGDDVRVAARLRQCPLREVAPAVVGEHRRRDEPRQGPQCRQATDDGRRRALRDAVAGRVPGGAHEVDPGPREQQHAGSDDDPARDAPQLLLVEPVQRREHVAHRARRQVVRHEPAEHGERGADDAARRQPLARRERLGGALSARKGCGHALRPG